MEILSELAQELGEQGVRILGQLEEGVMRSFSMIKPRTINTNVVHPMQGVMTLILQIHQP
jgi:hypothetical protein